MSSAASLHTPEKITLMRSMIPFLLANGPTPISTLAQHFDADENTVRRIVQFFGLAGIPGETATYQHEDLFDIDWDALEQRDEAVLVRTVVVHESPRFSAREVAAFIAGLQYLRSIPNFIDDEEITALMRKLADATDSPSMPSPISIPQQRPELSELHRATLEEGIAEFEYITRAGEQTVRRVFPLQLESLDNTWYLRAWCRQRQGERLFRVDRMSHVRVSLSDEITAERVALLGQQREPVRSGLSIPADATALRVTVQASGVDRLSALRRFEPEIEGNRATLHLADLSRAWDVASAAPGHLHVQEPPLARAAVAEWAGLALAQYDE